MNKTLLRIIFIIFLSFLEFGIVFPNLYNSRSDILFVFSFVSLVCYVFLLIEIIKKYL